MAEEYKALTYIMIGEEKKAPGDPITEAELKEAGQTEHIDQLIADGAIGSPDDEINEAHLQAFVEAPAESDVHVTATDGGSGK